MKNEIKNFFLSQINEHELVIEKTKSSVERNFLNLVNICVKSLKNGKKIIFFGNGGSAADAQHLSTELTVRFCENRKSIPALSLVTDTSAISAIGNDFGFKYIFSIDKTINIDDFKNDMVVIDKLSLNYLKNSILDYQETLIEKAFKIKNPNAQSSCGCGISFSL